MKVLLLLVGLSLINISYSQNNKTFNTVKIGTLEVTTEDFYDRDISWYTAVEMLEKIGQGWRLPTKEELNVLYQNKDKIGGFEPTDKSAKYGYWSSTEYGNDAAWWQVFNAGNEQDGGQGASLKSSTLFMRAVRDSK